MDQEQGRRPAATPSSSPNGNINTASEAAQAVEMEHSMGFVESLVAYRPACFWSVFLSTCIIMEGFDKTILSGLYAYPPFKNRFGTQQPDGSYELSAAWQSGLSNGGQVGQILGLFVNGIVADRFGYRKTLVAALVACAAAVFVIFFSQSLVQLLIGEILIGIPWGFFQTLAPTYAADVCPTHLRAYLTTYVNLCWVMGQFLASGVLRGMLDRHDEWGYRIPFALQWIWPLPLAVGIWLAPESPWWLVRHGRLDEARRSLSRLTRASRSPLFKIDDVVSMMVHTDILEREHLAGTTYLDLFRGVNLRRTEIVCLTWMIQQWCGASLMAYSTYFYQNAGMDVTSSFSMTLGLYAIGAVGTIGSWFLMAHFGRRTLYLFGQVAMLATLLAIGFCGALAPSGRDAVQWAVGSLLLVYTFAYDSTVGPVCYSLVSEMSSTRLRNKTVVLARNCYNVSEIVVNIITPRMLNPSAWGWGATSGFFFAGTTSVCVVWSFFRLPEPRGRTYAELDLLFERRVGARKFASEHVTSLDVPGEKDDGAHTMRQIEDVRAL